MPKLKLTFTIVRNIKKHLLEGKMTHALIAKKYGVSRSHITKISIGMKEPEKSYSRWKDITLNDNSVD